MDEREKSKSRIDAVVERYENQLMTLRTRGSSEISSTLEKAEMLRREELSKQREELESLIQKERDNIRALENRHAEEMDEVRLCTF